MKATLKESDNTSENDNNCTSSEEFTTALLQSPDHNSNLDSDSSEVEFENTNFCHSPGEWNGNASMVCEGSVRCAIYYNSPEAMNEIFHINGSVKRNFLNEHISNSASNILLYSDDSSHQVHNSIHPSNEINGVTSSNNFQFESFLLDLIPPKKLVHSAKKNVILIEQKKKIIIFK